MSCTRCLIGSMISIKKKHNHNNVSHHEKFPHQQTVVHETQKVQTKTSLESPVQDMLKSTHSYKEVDKNEIDSLLKDAKTLVKSENYNTARSKIEKIKEILSNVQFDPEYKKTIYYQIFELATDIDLQTK